MSARQSVRDMPVIVRALRRIKPEGTHKERSKKHQITSQERYKTINILGIRCASARRAKKRWSDSSLQVEDLKASGTPTSLAVACATFPSSSTIAVAHFIMHHDMSRKRLKTSSTDTLSTSHPT